jgi:hypothetical protein
MYILDNGEFFLNLFLEELGCVCARAHACMCRLYCFLADKKVLQQLNKKGKKTASNSIGVVLTEVLS